MDVNATRFHLLLGPDDWARCRAATGADDIHWDEDAQGVTLAPMTPRFFSPIHNTALGIEVRRGAACDRFGNFYWIGRDRQQIYWMPAGGRAPAVFWPSMETSAPPATGVFHPISTEPSPPLRLAGLAVTEHHYLVAGDAQQPGLLIIDLYSGGRPVRRLIPDENGFEPFDIAAAPEGGIWVLDRTRRVCWGLDSDFRILTGNRAGANGAPSDPCAFQPVNGSQDDDCLSIPQPEFFTLLEKNPIALACLPGNAVLILANGDETNGGGATLSLYRCGEPQWRAIPLPGPDGLDTGGSPAEAFVGHDLAVASIVDGSINLVVVDHQGDQGFAFVLEPNASPPSLHLRQDYLPMSYFAGRALVVGGDGIYYDLAPSKAPADAGTRWVKLQPVPRHRYCRQLELVSPVFDGKTRGCVWHRLFLDACIPPDASVKVWTRAADDADALKDETETDTAVDFLPEPELYLRGAGAEIPFHRSFGDGEADAPGRGTWELLFQRARGRYLQVKLALSGNGIVTPRLKTLRVYYPRFSYLQNYLPAVYLEKDAEQNKIDHDAYNQSFFLERLLANMEGFYSEIEGRIADVRMLFDPRSAPPDSLDWLASWLGLMLDPLWGALSERGGPDRRRLLIRFAHKLFEQRGTAGGIRFALILFLDPCLETLLQRFRRAALAWDPMLARELQRLERPYPSADLDPFALDEAFFEFMVAPGRQTHIRIVEQFLTRGDRAVLTGDSAVTGTYAGDGDGPEGAAHRFWVLIPEDLSGPQATMATRIVELEKPAHTRFDVVRYFDLFRVGAARLGQDTTLGTGSRFLPQALGRVGLAQGYLPPVYPLNIQERMIADRDRVGHLPSL